MSTLPTTTGTRTTITNTTIVVSMIIMLTIMGRVGLVGTGMGRSRGRSE
jgi:hypothetical protein